jgi:hypothetical protein
VSEQNTPVQAQLVAWGLRVVTQEAAQHPGSARFRRELHEALRAEHFPLAPTRADIRAGIAWLAQTGALPRRSFTDTDGALS